MEYVFDTEGIKERAREELNSDKNIEERDGGLMIPFVSSTDTGNRVYEQQGRLLQEKHRLSTLRRLQKDMEKLLERWGCFYKQQGLVARYGDLYGDPSLEDLWRGFLNYSGGKMKYRMRIKKSNKEVLEDQLKIKGDWTKESKGEFPIKKIIRKIKTSPGSIEKTRSDICEASMRLQEARNALKKEKYEIREGEISDQYRLDIVFNREIEEIKKRAQEALETGIHKKSPEQT